MEMASVELGMDSAEIEIALDRLRQQTPLPQLAQALDIGVPTLQDIMSQLVAPGRDPRDDVDQPLLRSDVLTVEDLSPGLRLHGTVRNVVDFGAFVDIGVKRDGLLHRSQIPRSADVQVGNVIEVVVRNVNAQRGRIDLGWVG
jgi:uncharacterized protein